MLSAELFYNHGSTNWPQVFFCFLDEPRPFPEKTPFPRRTDSDEDFQEGNSPAGSREMIQLLFLGFSLLGQTIH